VRFDTCEHCGAFLSRCPEESCGIRTAMRRRVCPCGINVVAYLEQGWTSGYGDHGRSSVTDRGAQVSPLEKGSSLSFEGRSAAISCFGGLAYVLLNNQLIQIKDGAVHHIREIQDARTSAAEMHVWGEYLVLVRDGRVQLFTSSLLEPYYDLGRLPFQVASASISPSFAWVHGQDGQIRQLSQFRDFMEVGGRSPADTLFANDETLFASDQAGIHRLAGALWETVLEEKGLALAAAIPRGLVAVANDGQSISVTRLQDGLKRRTFKGPKGLPHALATDGLHAAVITSEGMLAVADLDHGTWSESVSLASEGHMRVVGWAGNLGCEQFVVSRGPSRGTIRRLTADEPLGRDVFEIESCEEMHVALAGGVLLVLASRDGATELHAL
jgi:hypothetical protein